MCVLSRKFLLVFSSLFRVFFINLVVLEFEYFLYFCRVLRLIIWSSLRTLMLSWIETCGQILCNLLLNYFHSLLYETILFCSFDTYFKICFCWIKIPLIVLFTLFEKQPLTIVLAIFKVSHIKDQMSDFLAPVLSVKTNC